MTHLCGVNTSPDERETEFYNPAVNNYDLAKDPRCLWGWKPKNSSFGAACFRPLGHPGKCRDGEYRSQRPRDWDACGRAEANQ